MAKKNVRDEPLKPQVTENEQMSDIVLILDKMELLLQAVSKLDKDGRYETVPADKEHRNSFLKIDRYANMFENFLKKLLEPAQGTRHASASFPSRKTRWTTRKCGRPSKTSPPEKRQTRWRNSSNSTRLSPATRKTKVSTIKIKKKWQRKTKHSSRPPKVTARSSSPSTATTSP